VFDDRIILGNGPQLATRNARLAGVDATAIRGDAARLPLGDEAVDVVTFCRLLHDLPATAARDALADARRVCALGGRIGVLALPYPHDENATPATYWRELVADAGFAVDAVRERDDGYVIVVATALNGRATSRKNHAEHRRLPSARTIPTWIFREYPPNPSRRRFADRILQFPIETAIEEKYNCVCRYHIIWTSNSLQWVRGSHRTRTRRTIFPAELEYLNYRAVVKNGLSVDDDDLFEKASELDLSDRDHGTVEIDRNETLLRSAEANDLKWGSQCRSGTCNVCTAVLKSGEAEMDMNLAPRTRKSKSAGCGSPASRNRKAIPCRWCSMQPPKRTGIRVAAINFP